MKVLLVAATPAEIQPVIERLPPGQSISRRLTGFQHHQHQLEILITGVGMVATAFWCARTLSTRKPDLALNLGVCGSFTPKFPPGTVVHVVSDRISELGAEDGHAFLSVGQLGLQPDDEPPFRAGRLENPDAPAIVSSLPQAHGITVNTAHGNDSTIRDVVERWAPDIESMEGAAFLYACQMEGVPHAQVRAVSNHVERRNRPAWKIAEAIASLSLEASRILDEL